MFSLTKTLSLGCTKLVVRVPSCLVARLSSSADTKRTPEVGPTKKLSKAMKAYLERSTAYNEFIKKEEVEFANGKRHLANMMGRDVETFTQADIDEAIEYLFPSGLFETKARPFMKPPELVFPPRKDAQFDETGRPFSYLFYTAKPNFYSLMHELVSQMKKLENKEDELRNSESPVLHQVDLSGTAWLTKSDLERITVERITDVEYKNFTDALDRLASHKYSSLVEPFIMKQRTHLMAVAMDFSSPPKPIPLEDGKSIITTKECPRKSARADVSVIHPGTGLISINGHGIEYFTTIQARNQILYPLELTGMLGQVDIKATVRNGGETGQAGAIRWGIAWGLRSFVSTEMIETMRLAGLLTRDFRRRERKKPGQAGARRKFTWKKR